jgi:hypothetical protein
MGILSATYVQSIRRAAHPVTGPDDYNALLDRIGSARFVLIGEASHGTHEFYEQRAEITKRLIEEKQFTAIAVEALSAGNGKGEPLLKRDSAANPTRSFTLTALAPSSP